MSGNTNMFKNNLNKFYNVQTVSSSLAGILVDLYCFISERSVVEWRAMESKVLPPHASAHLVYRKTLWRLRLCPKGARCRNAANTSSHVSVNSLKANPDKSFRALQTTSYPFPRQTTVNSRQGKVFNTHFLCFFFHKEISQDPKVSEPKMLQ